MGVGLVCLCYAAYLFLNIQEPKVTDLVLFTPFGMLTALYFIWPLFDNISMISQMDPITILGLVVATIFIVFGAFFDDEKRSNEMFSWTFKIFVFIAGFEAGKVRQKAKVSNSDNNVEDVSDPKKTQ